MHIGQREVLGNFYAGMPCSLCYFCTTFLYYFIGNDHVSAQSLLESLWAYEEWKREKLIDSDADFVARAEDLRRRTSDRTVPGSSSAVENSPAQSVSNSGGREDNLCVVCMSASRGVVLMPCGHLAVCQSCYGRLQQCPICRSVIRGAIRSYL